MTVGGRLTRPGIEAGQADHESRIRRLERRPDAGNGEWVSGGYSGLVRANSCLVGYWPLNQNDPDSGSSYLPDLSLVGTPANLTQNGTSTHFNPGADGFPNVPGAVSVQDLDTNANGVDWPGVWFSAVQPKLNVTGGEYTVTAWISNGDATQGPLGTAPNGTQLAPLVGQFSPSALAFRGDGFLTPGGEGWMLLLSYATNFFGTPIFVSGHDSCRPVHGARPFVIANGAGEWTFLAVTVGASTISMYLDGTQVASTARTGTGSPVPSNPNLISIGGQHVVDVGGTSFLRGFDGNMNAVALFDCALTAGEIAALYQMSAPPDSSVWVPFDVSGSSIADHSLDPNKLIAAAAGEILTTDGTNVFFAAPSPRLQAAWFGTSLSAGSTQVFYVPFDGATSKTFTLARLVLRLETVAGGTTSINLERSPSGGAFTPTTIGTASLPAGSHEVDVTASLGTVTSGDLLRVTFTAVGSGAANWLVQAFGTSS